MSKIPTYPREFSESQLFRQVWAILDIFSHHVRLRVEAHILLLAPPISRYSVQQVILREAGDVGHWVRDVRVGGVGSSSIPCLRFLKLGAEALCWTKGGLLEPEAAPKFMPNALGKEVSVTWQKRPRAVKAPQSFMTKCQQIGTFGSARQIGARSALGRSKALNGGILMQSYFLGSNVWSRSDQRSKLDFFALSAAKTKLETAASPNSVKVLLKGERRSHKVGANANHRSLRSGQTRSYENIARESCDTCLRVVWDVYYDGDNHFHMWRRSAQVQVKSYTLYSFFAYL